ncbi:hypothetical protein CK203_046102 [Vitis vinifera]|uniref:Uncharacterized protein n=1 Tax=Vitis vinifera TaxID=29760 RepID=A0A438HP47_VITVI|nr:hypothetical protein CK203_046102 [Vitis vinifera]
MWRTLQKQDRGAKPRNRALISRCENFRTMIKVRIPSPKGAFRTPQNKVRKFSHRAKSSWHTSAIFAHLKPNFAPCETRCEISHSAKLSAKCIKVRIPQSKGCHFRTPNPRCEISVQGAKISHAESSGTRTATSSISAMQRLEEAFPPPHHHRRLDHSNPPWEAPLRHLFRPGHSPSEGEPLLSADTPPGGHPLNLCPADQARGLLLGPLQENQVLGSWRAIPCASGRAAYRGTLGFLWVFLRDRYQASHDSRTTDRGQLDCRDRSFHSETYFDIEALRQQPELRDSFRLLQRYHMEHLLTPRQFYYPRVVLDFYQSMTTRGLRNPTLIQFTIDGRQGAIGARHIAEALRIPYEPVIQADFREWSSFSQSDMVRILSRGTSTASVLTRRELPSGMLLIDVLLRANIFPLQHKVQRRGAILEALFRISEGYYFGPHHLIMTSLLHFEEKVHQKKLQRADGIPLLFPRLLCQILEHLGYPEEPRLRGAAIAERTSLSTNGITWQPQQPS